MIPLAESLLQQVATQRNDALANIFFSSWGNLEVSKPGPLIPAGFHKVA